MIVLRISASHVPDEEAAWRLSRTGEGKHFRIEHLSKQPDGAYLLSVRVYVKDGIGDDKRHKKYVPYLQKLVQAALDELARESYEIRDVRIAEILMETAIPCDVHFDTLKSLFEDARVFNQNTMPDCDGVLTWETDGWCLGVHGTGGHSGAFGPGGSVYSVSFWYEITDPCQVRQALGMDLVEDLTQDKVDTAFRRAVGMMFVLDPLLIADTLMLADGTLDQIGSRIDTHLEAGGTIDSFLRDMGIRSLIEKYGFHQVQDALGCDGLDEKQRDALMLRVSGVNCCRMLSQQNMMALAWYRILKREVLGVDDLADAP